MSLTLTRMSDLDLRGKRVLIREDLNAPVRDGRVTSSQRLEAALPTLRAALEAGAAVIVMSHRGRPAEGAFDAAFSLAPVATRLSELLGREVRLVRDWIDGVDVEPGGIVLCENVRFETGEKANDPALAKRMAALCDVFVMDAFGTAHRAQASTAGVAEHAPAAAAGPLLAAELEALDAALEHPRRPFVAIVGGAKVSSKLEVLRALAAKVDALIVGGGIANTLMAASGLPVGRSLVESDMLGYARELLAGDFGGAAIPLPSDVAVAPGLDSTARRRVVAADAVGDDDMILDIGPDTASDYVERVRGAGTVVWNGPLGVFENAEFAFGTEQIARAVAASDAFSIAGGGDTLAAVEQFGVGDAISYISTGGGAFLEFLEGRELPGVAAIAARSRASS